MAFWRVANVLVGEESAAEDIFERQHKVPAAAVCMRRHDRGERLQTMPRAEFFVN